MAYTLFAGLSFGGLILTLLWMFLERGEKRVFQKQTYKYWAYALLTGAILGCSGFLMIEPLDWVSPTALFVIFAVSYLLMGILYTHQRHLPELPPRALLRWELPLAASLVMWSMLGLFITLWMSEIPFFERSAGMSNTLAVAPLIGLLSPVLILVRAFWNEIPIIKQVKEPWMLPLDQPAPIIEPSADSLRLFFYVPRSYGSDERIPFDVDVPKRSTLAEVFHHLLYQYNVQQRKPRPIEIAQDGRRSELFGWLLYTEIRQWWRTRRIYLDMNGPVKYSNLKSGDRIFAERTLDR